VVAFGDCAVTGNVTAMRNPLGAPGPILQQIYGQAPDTAAQIPSLNGIVPRLLDRVRPLHEVVRVDAFLPGCPPPAERIRLVLEQALSGAVPRLEGATLKAG
jgi:NAD-reducing hydrogenase small subunit